jgi:hypothetical protein
LVEQLREGRGPLADAIELYRHRWTPQFWVYSLDTTFESNEICGPGGFSLDFRKGLVDVYHLIRFDSFACIAEEQTILRKAFYQLAQLLDTGECIYKNELMHYEGATLDEVARSLTATFGPAAMSFAELCKSQSESESGGWTWIIDDFADLR